MKFLNSCLWCVVAATGFIFLASPASAQQFTAENLLKSSVRQIGPQHRDVADALEDFKASRFLDCRDKLTSAREKDKSLPPVGVMMAQMLYAAKQQGTARVELEGVVNAEPTDPEPYLLFGEIAFQQRRFSEAELSFRKAGELTQKFTGNDYRKTNLTKRAYSGLAGVAETRKDWTSAAKFLQPLLAIDANDINNTTRMARAIFEQDDNVGDSQGKEKEAYQLLANLYKANPKTVRRPEITMGSMYQGAGKKDFSAKLMKRASTEDAQGLSTQLTVARWALGSGDLALAQACSDRAVQINSGSMEARLVAGLTARYSKDYSKARKILESAHLQSPGNLAAILQLAVVLVEGSDDDRRIALEYSSVANRMHPDMGSPTGREAAVTSAWIYYRQGRMNEAGLVLQKALASGGVSAESSYFAAEIIHQSNPEIAKKLLATALKGDGVFPARPEAEKLQARLGG